MNKRTRLAALRIALIEEEFTRQEIREAVRILEGDAVSPELLARLLENGDGASGSAGRSRRRRPLHLQQSRPVAALRDSEPDKYALLSQLDRLLREGKILPHVDDIRRLGESLSKGFSSRRSRRDAISKLMGVLAARPLEEIRETFDQLASSSATSEAGYQELADFIIGGSERG